jgi:hypothetical protein
MPVLGKACHQLSDHRSVQLKMNVIDLPLAAPGEDIFHTEVQTAGKPLLSINDHQLLMVPQIDE